MKKINKTRYAILGMLADRPRSGYEIRKFMLESTAHFWQESDASVYPMLKKLAAEKKVTACSEHFGKRKRKIFEITPAGKKEFSAWLAIPAERENRRSELLLKLFFGAHATPDDVIKKLLQRRQQVLDAQKKFEKIDSETLAEVADTHPHKMFWAMTLQYGIKLTEAEIEWIDDCVKGLKNET